MAKVTVTGASGFIGYKVVLELLEKGHIVTAITTQPVEEVSHEKTPNLTWITHNINQIEIDAFSKLGSPDILIHLAWGNLRDLNHDDHCKSELNSHITFLKSMISSGLKKVFISGTCQEYKIINGSKINEDFAIKPITKYAKAKNILRKEIMSFVNDHDCQLIWGRIFYVYGDNQQQQTLYGQFLNAVESNYKFFEIQNPTCVRDYISIDELVFYIIKLLQTDRKITIVNLCSGKPIRILDLVKRWIDEKNIKLSIKLTQNDKVKNHEIDSFWGDNSFLKSLIH